MPRAIGSNDQLGLNARAALLLAEEQQALTKTNRMNKIFIR
jgi:hypothetical protein